MVYLSVSSYSDGHIGLGQDWRKQLKYFIHSFILCCRFILITAAVNSEPVPGTLAQDRNTLMMGFQTYTESGIRFFFQSLAFKQNIGFVSLKPCNMMVILALSL